MPELAVMWLEKKFNKSESMFYNTKGKCCANSQVKKFATSRDLYNSTTTNSTNATENASPNGNPQVPTADQLMTGMSLVHVLSLIHI